MHIRVFRILLGCKEIPYLPCHKDCENNETVKTWTDLFQIFLKLQNVPEHEELIRRENSSKISLRKQNKKGVLKRRHGSANCFDPPQRTRLQAENAWLFVGLRCLTVSFRLFKLRIMTRWGLRDLSVYCMIFLFACLSGRVSTVAKTV